MLFNLELNRQTKEALFSPKVIPDDQTKLMFNGNKVQQCSSQKFLESNLDNKTDFNKHLDEKISKCNRIIGLIKKLSLSVSKQSSLTSYKLFVRSNLDYDLSDKLTLLRLFVRSPS